MSQTTAYNGGTLTTVIPNSVRYVEVANMGEVGIGSAVLDDDAGTTTITGLKGWTVTQSSAPAGNQRLFTGYVADRSYHRGQKYMVGAGREIDVTIVDINTLLGDKVITGTDGNRSAETVSDRLTWLLASSYVAFADKGQVVYAPRSMDAVDYRGQTPGDVLADCASAASGFNYFLYYDEATAAVALWFNTPDASSSTYASTTKISNVAADVDGTTVLAPLMDADMTRSPAKIASGVYVPYAKGATYRTNATTASTYRAHDVVATNANVKNLATAQALGDQLLTQDSTEDDVVRCSVWVLPANVNDIRAGHLIQAKFSHLNNEGYGSYSYFRVLRRTVTQPQNTDSRYQVDLELTPVTPLTLTASFARIDYPSDDFTGSTGQATPLNFFYTGDSPKAGWPSAPKYGLMAYDTSHNHSFSIPTGSGLHSGIKMLGSGTVTVWAQIPFQWGLHGTSGAYVDLGIYKNGVLIAGTAAHAEAFPILAGVATMTADVNVVTNDILEVYSVLGRPEGPGVPTAGVASPDFFYAIGDLS